MPTDNPLNESEYQRHYGVDNPSTAPASDQPYSRKYGDPAPPVLPFSMKWGKFGREYKWFLLMFGAAMVLCRLLCHFHTHFHYIWCFIAGWGMTCTMSIIGTYKQVAIGNSPTLMGGLVIGSRTPVFYRRN